MNASRHFDSDLEINRRFGSLLNMRQPNGGGSAKLYTVGQNFNEPNYAVGLNLNELKEMNDLSRACRERQGGGSGLRCRGVVEGVESRYWPVAAPPSTLSKPGGWVTFNNV